MTGGKLKKFAASTISRNFRASSGDSASESMVVVVRIPATPPLRSNSMYILLVRGLCCGSVLVLGTLHSGDITTHSTIAHLSNHKALSISLFTGCPAQRMSLDPHLPPALSDRLL